MADTLVLWIGLPDHFLLETFNIDLRYTSVSCKLYPFLNTSAGTIANWLIIVFTIFRVISVYVPHKANMYCSKMRANLAIILTVIVIVAYETHYFIGFKLNNVSDEVEGNYTNCYAPTEHLVFYDNYQSWIALIMVSLAPFAVLIIGNMLIIHKLRKANLFRQTMNSTASSNDSNSMMAMLISISILFLVSQTPFIITTLIEYKLNYNDYSAEFRDGYFLLEAVTKLLTYVNNVANFFCYSISGKQFRQELISMFKFGRGNQRQSKEGRSLETLSTAVDSNATGVT